MKLLSTLLSGFLHFLHFSLPNINIGIFYDPIHPFYSSVSQNDDRFDMTTELRLLKSDM